MSTLASAETQAECRRRADQLTPGMKPKWGKMTAPQMICHLNDSFDAATGVKPFTSVANLFTKTVMKYGALYAPLKWPQGVKTLPELEQGAGGTPPTSWDRDLEDLRAHLTAFPARARFGQHAMFGNLTYSQWMIWAYRHVDHHLRQFGV